MYVGVAVRGRFGGSLAVAWSCFRFRELQVLFSMMLLGIDKLGQAYFRSLSVLLAAGLAGKDSDLSGELGILWSSGPSIEAEVFVGLWINQSLSTFEQPHNEGTYCGLLPMVPLSTLVLVSPHGAIS